MAEPEVYSPDVLAEEEPRYMRRQKPVEIRRRKFGKQQRLFYLKVFLGLVAALAGGALLYQAGHFLLFSPQFLLTKPEQIEIAGSTRVDAAVVLDKFAADQGRSVLRVPLDERRRALEEIPWVEQARVARILPNKLRVELVERTPVAFLRQGAELALIDAHGVVLERPQQADYHFPVVTGIAEAAPRDDRERQMKLFVQFMKDVEVARPGAAGQVSEVDLADPKDVRATIAGLPELGDPQTGGQSAVLVHFGVSDFLSKYQVFVENIGQWRASAGRVESIDLRFERQVVVNPEAQANSTPKLGPGKR
ncbi:MAG: FtsQ-type POTRA domain-containing protein [Acidobacteria bacterium]|nr:FtsQ-type POTRA domain-containing protein [Acidobacteriota bacterium]MBI3662415.1 FtsQ-type POTRA domain-containing protein [Acidobacteriota bacterium]